MEFYVMCLCEEEIVLIPFSSMGTIKKEVTLQIPYSDIKAVEVKEDGFNYIIEITTNEDSLRLTAQQKELSDLRSTGILAVESKGLNVSNWHKENIEETLKMLRDINK